MAKRAAKLIQQKKFQTTEQEVVVTLLIAGTRLRKFMEAECAEEGITLPQFNILRILKGVHPGAHPRAEVRKRMIDNSDVTRLIDRLEQMKLVERLDPEHDARHSLTRITKKGIAVSDRVAERLHKSHGVILGDLSATERGTLRSLLERLLPK